jgi:hypothetical protein
MKRPWVLAMVLLSVGLLQMTGELVSLIGFQRVGAVAAGIAAATGASPAPKVFSAVRGLETYSTRFFLEWDSAGGVAHSVELTPELYARMKGPYNRRNVYGAVLAYGPVLVTTVKTRPMFESVMRRALCGAAPLLQELGIDASDRSGSVRIRYVPVPNRQVDELPFLLDSNCP